MWNCTKNDKCCATCANWSGERIFKGYWATVSAPGVRAKCYAGVPGSGLPGPAACEGRSCPKYSLWPAMK